MKVSEEWFSWVIGVCIFLLHKGFLNSLFLDWLWDINLSFRPLIWLWFFLKIPNWKSHKLFFHEFLYLFEEGINNFDFVINFFQASQIFEQLNKFLVQKSLLFLNALLLFKFSHQNFDEFILQENFMKADEALDNE